MARKAERKSLGRGLSALLGDAAEEVPAQAPDGQEAPIPSDRAVQTLPIDLIHPNPGQPRRDFNEQDLEELAESIRAKGVIQPVILRRDPADDRRYQIVAGERRWRAAQRAGLHELPVVVRDLDDRDVLELAIIENIQRADLNPVEEALGYNQLIEKFQYTQEALAKIVGKSRPHLANTLRLLVLPTSVQQMVRDGKLSAGHARALITSPDPVALANLVVAKGLSVRQTEELARKQSTDEAKPAKPSASEKDADTRQIEGDLSAALGMKVSIEHGQSGKGELRIRYKSLDDLDRLMQQLGG
ncbi:ParB/RepB/Spo0J family partition protein [Rhodobacteraceae bacterium NNCM2]|nr:ParB/RepB/Spo0J family partition protein [Coraliihabitans acroporae]